MPTRTDNTVDQNELLVALNNNTREMSLLRQQIASIMDELKKVTTRVNELEEENRTLKSSLEKRRKDFRT